MQSAAFAAALLMVVASFALAGIVTPQELARREAWAKASFAPPAAQKPAVGLLVLANEASGPMSERGAGQQAPDNSNAEGLRRLTRSMCDRRQRQVSAWRRCMGCENLKEGATVNGQ